MNANEEFGSGTFSIVLPHTRVPQLHGWAHALRDSDDTGKIQVMVFLPIEKARAELLPNIILSGVFGP
jgi:hypothetical protein